jgi:hypothetical protein
VARVEGRSGLGGQHGEDLDAFHVLFDVGSVDRTDDGSTGHQGCREYALGQLGSRGTPRGLLAVEAGDFDLNATRHRVLI